MCRTGGTQLPGLGTSNVRLSLMCLWNTENQSENCNACSRLNYAFNANETVLMCLSIETMLMI